ncbi:MAG: hypothetical protein OEZ10_13835 [Gammaproteobacteria bacterium]|nr:hypothetical protein [Gammaproteobacteria bacterium]
MAGRVTSSKGGIKKNRGLSPITSFFAYQFAATVVFEATLAAAPLAALGPLSAVVLVTFLFVVLATIMSLILDWIKEKSVELLCKQ